MFGNAKQSIPLIFREKMTVDSKIKTIKEMTIIPSEFFKNLREEQTKLRRACERFISDQKLSQLDALYTPVNNDKTFVSIDIRSANYTMLKKRLPA